MTKLYALLLIVFLFSGLFSCKKYNPVQAPIAGRWHLQSLTGTFYEDNNDVYDLDGNSSETLESYVQFNTDSSYTYTNIYTNSVDSIGGSYNLSGNILSLSNLKDKYYDSVTPIPFPLVDSFLGPKTHPATLEIMQLTANSLVIRAVVISDMAFDNFDTNKQVYNERFTR